jgi:glycine dehydrogenase
VAADLAALLMLRSPGAQGADAVLGNSQRFGVPMGFGGPHAAFFATRDAFKRSHAGPHHRRVDRPQRATRPCAWRCRRASSISAARRPPATSARRRPCWPIVAALYAMYHGPAGLRRIAERMHRLAGRARRRLAARGIAARHAHSFFDTLTMDVPRRAAGSHSGARTRRRLQPAHRGRAAARLVSFDETTTARMS